MKSRLVRLLFVPACFLVVLSVSGFTSTEASDKSVSDPQVLVAVDATLPSCYYVRIPGNHTSSGDNTAARGLVSGTHISCPTGTVMELASVPLSLARAKHDAYVLPLPSHATLAQQRQWEDRVQQLMQAKKLAIQANLHATPSTTCGYTVEIYSGYQQIFEDYIQGRVLYYVSSNCSQVSLDTAYIDVGYVPYDNSVWWVGFYYASYQANCKPLDLLYPNSTYSLTINQTHTAGYYAVFYLQWGDSSGCQINGGGEIYRLNVGPLN